jgi:cell division protein FtsZ
MVQEAAHEDANIIFGLVTDPNMEDVVKVTVIATGFDTASIDAQLTAAGAQHAHHPSASYQAVTPAQSVRSPAQQALARSAAPQAMPVASAPRAIAQTRTVLARPAQRVESAPRHASLAEAQITRAFGAGAMGDEAVLDIPAYLRRSRNRAGE